MCDIFDMSKCRLCPRECGVNRIRGERGYCGESADIRAAKVSLHMWEEPCLTGPYGSGTVFFSGCPLHCVYCQNAVIANGSVGWKLDQERLSEIFLEQQERKASNINLVTAGHFLPIVIEALKTAKGNGLTIPVVYNTSGYEKAEALKGLEGLVDIYLPDFKYMDRTLAGRYSRAADYPEVAKAALDEMVRQTKGAVFDGELLKRGTLVRHLLLPGQLKDSMEILTYLYRRYGDSIYISIMNQFTPAGERLEKEYPELNRRVLEEEYEALVDFAIDLGIENGFIQEGETAEESFIPEFDGQFVRKKC